MDIAGRHFLAGPRLSGQHHPTIGFGNLVQLDPQGAESGRIAQHFRGIGFAAFQFDILAAQTRHFHCAADHHHQLINIERLFDEIISPLFDRRDRNFNISVTRDDDDGHIGMFAFYGFQDVDPVHLAIFQPDIQDHQRR